MKHIVSDAQAAFFTKQGFIEFELGFEMPPFHPLRDQWREDESLKLFILKQLGPIALRLSGKKQLRLALSEWVTEKNRPRTGCPLIPSLSLQQMALAVAICPSPPTSLKKSPLGILPFPSKSSQVLFFKPHLILDWPHVDTDLFLILFGLFNTVYIQNSKDPDTTYLKKLGYEYGDTLHSRTHPLIYAHS